MRKLKGEPKGEGLHTSKMVRMGDADLRRLRQLVERLEVKESAVLRRALRELAEREGIE